MPEAIMTLPNRKPQQIHPDSQEELGTPSSGGVASLPSPDDNLRKVTESSCVPTTYHVQ